METAETQKENETLLVSKATSIHEQTTTKFPENECKHSEVSKIVPTTKQKKQSNSQTECETVLVSKVVLEMGNEIKNVPPKINVTEKNCQICQNRVLL